MFSWSDVAGSFSALAIALDIIPRFCACKQRNVSGQKHQDKGGSQDTGLPQRKKACENLPG